MRVIKIVLASSAQRLLLSLIIVLLVVTWIPRSLSAQSKPSDNQSQQTGKVVSGGISVEFSIAPTGQERSGTAGLPEGTEASVRFKITDSVTGQPLSNLRPSAWIDHREVPDVPDARQCREKIQSFLQASLTNRPDIDLNAYLILALNQEPNISVIDPLSGFGGSKLYTLVALSSPGEDWLMSGDKLKLFVTMPAIGKVAVVDTSSWKVLYDLDAGPKPTRIALQNDEKYLWIANDSDDGGVAVIDPIAKKTVAQFKTGLGPHDIAITDDDRFAFVSNPRAGSLSIIDMRRLALVKTVRVGPQPSAVAYSNLSKALYVADETDGTITVVGGARHEVLARIATKPGLSNIKFAPGGRYGFVVNRRANLVHIFDGSTNRLLHNVPVGPDPDQIVFTTDVAYVRARGNEFVSLINLSSIGNQEIEVSVNRFPAGQKAPQVSRFTSVANAMIVAPDGGAVLVANPADKMIYYYMEGMAAPMGTFQNYRREPRALLAWSRSLRETSPGTYTTSVKLGRRGNYDVPFLLDSPRMVHCFDFAVSANPAYKSRPAVPIRIEPLTQAATIRAGEKHVVRFKVVDIQTQRPRADLKDLNVLTFLAPGIWQQRDLAKPRGEGIYEVEFVPPQSGVYYIFFKCPSLGVEFNQLPSLTLQASESDKRPSTPPQNQSGVRP